MSTENQASGPFDPAVVRTLVEMMAEFEVNEIDLRDGDKRITLRRGGLPVMSASAPVLQAMPPAYSNASANGAPAAPPPAAAPGKKYLEIKSPMVGTFYAKPAPDKDDYVKVGARVSEDSIVCKIEAMKIFNDLAAGVSGTIAEVLVQNSEPVEYDQVLFRVDPS